MTTWTPDDLRHLAAVEEVDLATRRADGSLRKARTIWLVEVDGGVYVRSVNGTEAAWFRGTRATGSGVLSADGVDWTVALIDVLGDINRRVDAAYRTKYRAYAADTLDRITSATASATTMRLEPQS